MIRLKVFISSVQKELREERAALGGMLATDAFLSSATVPRIFEEYPAPLRPNKQAYLDLLRSCHAYLLVVGREYGEPQADGLSATHQEYRLAQELRLPTLVCVKGDSRFERDEKEAGFFEEVRQAGHTYSRFASTDELLHKTRARLIEYLESTFETEPTQQQNVQAREASRSASGFERQPVHALEFDDLDPQRALKLAAAAEDKAVDKLTGEGVTEALVSRGYLWFDSKGNLYRPTAAAVLLLARTPAKVFSQARLQLDAYSGTGRDAQPLDSVLVDAPLPAAVEQAVAFIRRNTAHPLRVEGLRRLPSEAFPQEALREAAVNAVAHRDYEDAGAKVTVEVFADRVVFSSPGHPPGDQKMERIQRGEGRSRARNPLVVQGLAWLGLMDERGSGIRRMREAMTRQGLDVPRFALVEDEFTATLSGHRTEAVERPERAPRHQDPLLREPVTDRQKQILRQVLEAGFVTSAACVQALGIAKDTAWRDLNDLIAQGYVRITGAGRASRYVAAPRLQAISLSENQTQIGRKSDETPLGQTQVVRKPSGTSPKQPKSGSKVSV